MADTLKVLGQLAPDATTDTDLYTVPSETVATISSIAACNRSGGALTIRVAVRPQGATVASITYTTENQLQPMIRSSSLLA